MFAPLTSAEWPRGTGRFVMNRKWFVVMAFGAVGVVFLAACASNSATTASDMPGTSRTTQVDSPNVGPAAPQTQPTGTTQDVKGKNVIVHE
jgi:hypothetical protein